jgi:hemerythrin superfamily protein
MAAKKKKKGAAGARKLPEAMAMLAKDHKLVAGMFRQYERGDDQDEQRALLQAICAALTAHAQLEEELFYPALREALSEEDAELLDEATVEHSTVKALIAELEGAEPGEELVDAKVTVLSEYVKHHVKEEEDEIFPKARKARELDLDDLAERMAARKAELEAEAGVTDDDDEPPRGRRSGSRTPVGARG